MLPEQLNPHILVKIYTACHMMIKHVETYKSSVEKSRGNSPIERRGAFHVLAFGPPHWDISVIVLFREGLQIVTSNSHGSSVSMMAHRGSNPEYASRADPAKPTEKLETMPEPYQIP